MSSDEKAKNPSKSLEELVAEDFREELAAQLDDIGPVFKLLYPQWIKEIAAYTNESHEHVNIAIMGLQKPLKKSRWVIAPWILSFFQSLEHQRELEHQHEVEKKG